MEIVSESTGEAWEKLSVSLIDAWKKQKRRATPMIEIRWIDVHVNKPLKEPRISDKYNDFSEKIKFGEDMKPTAYYTQVTGKIREGYWWNVYGKLLWEQIPKLEEILERDPYYNKPSIILRDSERDLGASNTPCLVYLTFLIRNKKLELGVHFDTNAIEYIQGNMYGLSEVQKIVAEKLGFKVGTYHHYCDSLLTSEEYIHHLADAIS